MRVPEWRIKALQLIRRLFMRIKQTQWSLFSKRKIIIPFISKTIYWGNQTCIKFTIIHFTQVCYKANVVFHLIFPLFGNRSCHKFLCTIKVLVSICIVKVLFCILHLTFKVTSARALGHQLSY